MHVKRRACEGAHRLVDDEGLGHVAAVRDAMADGADVCCAGEQSVVRTCDEGDSLRERILAVLNPLRWVVLFRRYRGKP
jgi:hypothetical protein